MKYAFDPCKHFVVLNKIAAFNRGYPALHGRNKLRLESFYGPNAGLTEVLVPAGYVTTVYYPA